MRDTKQITFVNKIRYYRPDRKLQKTGNSLHVSIPVQYVREYRLVAGQVMKVLQDENGRLVMEPGPKPDPYDIQHRRKNT